MLLAASYSDTLNDGHKKAAPELARLFGSVFPILSCVDLINA